MKKCLARFAYGMVVGLLAAQAFGGGIPEVRKERPRLFWRTKTWDGPSVERIKTWLERPEYKARMDRLKGKGMLDAMRYRLLGDEEAGRRAVQWLKSLKVPTGKPKDSPSLTGMAAVKKAAVYDWMRDHPDFDEEGRRAAIAHFEWWGDYFHRYLPGCVPFYSRNSGATAGLTAVGLALHGDSQKAQKYLSKAFVYLRENLGTIREAEDGATGGGTYAHTYQFIDCANTIALWRSATDWDAAEWIKTDQGNWLERQMLYQIWTTYPNGWFWKEGDIWGNHYRDKYEHAIPVAAVAGMYRNGLGRTHAENIRKRWGSSAYYRDRVAWFFLYNDPAIKAEPLSRLGHGDVFSPNLHGAVCWRSSWDAHGACVIFKTGDNVDHHGTWDTGKFSIFKHTPLAIKNGYYQDGYKSARHMYYRSPWSANVVVFDGENHGWQQGMPDLDNYTSWKTWKAKRDTLKHPVSGKLLKNEVNDAYARALADLSGSTYPTGSSWTRELMFLGYRYLLVLDRVKPGAGTKTRWLLHSINEPAIDVSGRVATIDNGNGRLFCRSLLPEKAEMIKVGGKARAFVHKDRSGKEISWPYAKGGRPSQRLGAGRLDVVPRDETAEQVYLHVLYPTDTGTSAMPPCSVKKVGDAYAVKVGALTYTFK